MLNLKGLDAIKQEAKTLGRNHSHKRAQTLENLQLREKLKEVKLKQALDT